MAEDAKVARKRRLAEALRANLKRRKVSAHKVPIRPTSAADASEGEAEPTDAAQRDSKE